MSFFKNLRAGLAKTRGGLVSSLKNAVQKDNNEELRETLEEVLIMGDVGVHAADRIIESIAGREGDRWELLEQEMLAILGGGNGDGPYTAELRGKPHVILLVGTNGSGKTTTAGKLAAKYASQGKSVILAAGDTFRAAAIEQLEVWGTRAGVEVISQERGSDAASVAYDSLTAAIAREADLLIVDTAGRLQNRSNLMDELTKIRRVLKKHGDEYPHETFLVLDATIGQNALSQARLFHEAVALDGLIVTKLDGTAKGGMILAVRQEVDLPVRYVGVGEGIDDLMPFAPEEFVKALLD